MSHTPIKLPIKVNIVGDYLEIKDADGEDLICDWPIVSDPAAGIFCDREEEIAKFNYLCKAANNHDKLVEALRAIQSKDIQTLRDYCKRYKIPYSDYYKITLLRYMIAKYVLTQVEQEAKE